MAGALSKGSTSPFLSFPEISEYVKYWAERERLELRNVRQGDPKIACRASSVTNDITYGGIAFNLFLDGQPITERMAVCLSCAASLKDGTAFSMSQAKQVMVEYLWLESRRLWKEIQDQTIDGEVVAASGACSVLPSGP